MKNELGNSKAATELRSDMIQRIIDFMETNKISTKTLARKIGMDEDSTLKVLEGREADTKRVSAMLAKMVKVLTCNVITDKTLEFMFVFQVNDYATVQNILTVNAIKIANWRSQHGSIINGVQNYLKNAVYQLVENTLHVAQEMGIKLITVQVCKKRPKEECRFPIIWQNDDKIHCFWDVCQPIAKLCEDYIGK